MNVAGILVVVPSTEIAVAVETLATLPGVDIHHIDTATGRIIVTQEAGTIVDEIAALKRIKALSYVIMAEMVHHHFEDDPQISDATRSELDDERPARVPRMLDR